MELLAKKTHYIILFSYYQALLTPRQRQIFSFYYEEDYSLSEISEELKISRNAVSDTLGKVTKELDHFEELLSLRAKDLKREELYEKYKDDSTLLIQKLKEME